MLRRVFERTTPEERLAFSPLFRRWSVAAACALSLLFVLAVVASPSAALAGLVVPNPVGLRGAPGGAGVLITSLQVDVDSVDATRCGDDAALSASQSTGTQEFIGGGAIVTLPEDDLCEIKLTLEDDVYLEADFPSLNTTVIAVLPVGFVEVTLPEPIEVVESGGSPILFELASPGWLEDLDLPEDEVVVLTSSDEEWAALRDALRYDAQVID